VKSGGFYGASFSKFIIMNEIWKDIEVYEGYYEVSNLGRVKSLAKTIKRGSNHLTIQERILKQINNGNNYVRICLCKDGLKKFYVHRLVASAFIEKKDHQDQVNHINKITNDNRVENLEWVSNRENCCHSRLTRNHRSKYNGVIYSNDRKKWLSHIKIGDAIKFIGRFNTEKEAHNARVNYELNNNIINKYNGKNEISI